MDGLDFAIFRELAPGGEARFWASRRIIDPRATAAEIAAKVGLSETAVRTRLKSLETRGFLRSSEVWPNPSLFGVSLCVAEMPVPDAEQAGRLVEELALVDGVVFARDILDEDDRKLRIHYVSDTEGATARRTALLRRLSPGGRLRGPEPYWIPPCERELTPLDWRMLRAFRTRPDGTLAEVAGSARVSLKTATRRFHSLLEARACWWAHSGESEEMPLALVRVSLPDGAHRADVMRRVAVELPAWMPVAADGVGLPPERQPTLAAGLVPIETPTHLERTVRRIRSLAGVPEARRTFALGSAGYPQWYDERIDARAGAARGAHESK